MRTLTVRPVISGEKKMLCQIRCFQQTCNLVSGGLLGCDTVVLSRGYQCFLALKMEAIHPSEMQITTHTTIRHHNKEDHTDIITVRTSYIKTEQSYVTLKVSGQIQVWSWIFVRVRVCVCACVRACARARARVCVCVSERERKRGEGVVCIGTSLSVSCSPL
jgi:hypothetical protein